MSDIHSQLDEVIQEQRRILADIQQNMAEIRQIMTNEHPNVTLANNLLDANGYMHESYYKHKQWGILEAKTDAEVQQIISGVIDYRKEHSSN